MPNILHIANQPNLTETELIRLLQTQNPDEIDVKNCTAVGGRVLQLLAEKYPELKSLRWIGNGPTNYRAVVELLSLRALNVSGNADFTSTVCGELLRKSRSLRCLDVSFCPVTDDAFEEIGCPLVFVNLQGCSQITNRTLTSLAQVPTLRHVLLGFNEKLTSDGSRVFGPGVQIHRARISEI